LEEERAIARLSEIIKIGGYLVAGGALVGFSIGIYLIFNNALFSFFKGVICIGQSEVLSYFLSIFIPSFVILVVTGYLFATTLELKRVSLSNIIPLCTLAILCMVFSALSIFYLISFLGGALALMAVIRAHARPRFKNSAERRAFFLMETGAMFVASFSLLSFSMWLISNFFPSYAKGFYEGYSPFSLLMVGTPSILTFFATSPWSSRGTNAGKCGALGLVMIILSCLFVAQNRYVLSNASAYISVFMLILGYVLSVAGDLTCVRLSFSKPPDPIIAVTASLLNQGTYCPYCGKPRVTASQSSCSHCGRSLMWTPYAPFCTSCGRLVPTNAQTCPHCLENIGNKLMYFDLEATEEQAIAGKVMKESTKEKSRIPKASLSLPRRLRPVWQELGKFYHSVKRRLPQIL
jgi:hypothetical protein